MCKRSIALFLVLGIWRMMLLLPSHAVVVDGPASTGTTTMFIRLYGGRSIIYDDAPEGGDSNVAFTQFHALSQMNFPVNSNVTDVFSVDSHCTDVSRAILEILRISNESRVDEDGMNAVLRMIFDWDPFEHLYRMCLRDVTVRKSLQHSGSPNYDIYSFVYSKTSTTLKTSHSILPPPPFNISGRFYKLYGFNQSAGAVQELPLNDRLIVSLNSNENTNSLALKDTASYFYSDHWNVHLDTKLSPSGPGGMHRDLHNTLHFYTERSLPVPTNTKYHGSLDMLLHLPSDLYINVEDCFHWKDDPQNKFQIKAISAVKPSLIDQEEPAFVSPVHVLQIQIQFSVLFSPTFAFISEEQQQHDSVLHRGSLEFVTQLHARYPKPLSSQEGHNFLLVLIPPPIMTSRNIHSQMVVLDWMPLRDEPEWLQWWVAPGHQSDFPYVLGITVAVAVIGAMWMLRDLSLISVWN
jgi:hypothetical protein